MSESLSQEAYGTGLEQQIDAFASAVRIAYFSMEIAINTDIHTYSGGLGVLAGDTARSCSDLELPVVFVTLISRAGYFRQTLDAQGQQEEHEDSWEPEKWARPLPAMIAVPMDGRNVWIRPWLHVQVGTTGYRIPILFLDTDLEENHPSDRTLTHSLYGGDPEYRLKQELILGVGGIRLLRALGFVIDTYHLNEGHAAFLAVELLHRLRLPVSGECDTAQVRKLCIFTTHTPVEAAHDRFRYDLIERVVGDLFDISELRRHGGADSLNMTRLALSLSGYVNGVALRHAQTAERMFPGVGIRAITNGVHVRTWTHESFARLYDKAIPSWSHEPELLARADQLDASAVRQAHHTAKVELIEGVRTKTGIVLTPQKPIIGLARRMTGYKRPALLFSDIGKLKKIAERYPFQIVIAGKAHPKDAEGKLSISRINAAATAIADIIPCAYLPNYDLDVAKAMISGADIWLNTPEPPLEASGTSGMKAALNGVLNLSVLDGWWVEAWIEGVTGWSIGDDAKSDGNDSDAAALYSKLEATVLPLYYTDPDRWVWMMTQGISKISSYFNSQRMMRRYASEAYLR